ncbi:hypothetical protein HDU93_008452 [Gonapodya sp. JEL0774]|nr:hypothetical protein HDU93_008452 [Gonapodya sp. JEL0774]
MIRRAVPLKKPSRYPLSYLPPRLPADALLLGLDPAEFEELRKEFEKEQITDREESREESPGTGNADHADENERRSGYSDGPEADRKYQELRQEKALLNWQRQSDEWRKIERRIAETVGRSPPGLLSQRSPPPHRRRLESSLALDLALRARERAAGCDFWHTGYRLGYDRWGVVMEVPRGGMREIERVISPGDSGGDGKERGDRTMTPFEQFRERRMKEVELEMAEVDPFWGHPNPGFMEVVGTSPFSYPTPPQDSRPIDSTSTVAPTSVDVNCEPAKITPFSTLSPSVSLPPPPYLGPRLIIPLRRLAFEASAGEVAVGCVTIYNVGTTSVWFEWREAGKGARRIGLGSVNDGGWDQLTAASAPSAVGRFFFTRRRVSVLPGRAFDVPVAFQSETAGRFEEAWRVESDPKCAIGGWEAGSETENGKQGTIDTVSGRKNSNSNNEEGVVIMVGSAIQVDANAVRRQEIVANLRRRRAITAARAVIDHILNDIPASGTISGAHVVIARGGKQAVDAEEREFLFRNADMHLYYYPTIVAQLEDLAGEIARVVHGGVVPAGWRWNRSIDVLNDLAERVPSPSLRSTLLRRLNDHVLRLLQSPAGSIDRVAPQLARDVVAGLCEEVAVLSWNLREERGLDTKRKCLIKFMQGVGEPPIPESTSTVGAAGTAGVGKSKPGEKAPVAGTSTGKPGTAAPGGKDSKLGAATAGKKDEKVAVAAPVAVKVGDQKDGGLEGPVGDLWKSDVPANYTAARWESEKAYRAAFKVKVRQLVVAAIDRMDKVMGAVTHS